jgi:hypothetical protein
MMLHGRDLHLPRRRRFQPVRAVTYCLALAATEPFVAMANQSKYEYVTFFSEVQPIGIMAPGRTTQEEIDEEARRPDGTDPGGNDEQLPDRQLHQRDTREALSQALDRSS